MCACVVYSVVNMMNIILNICIILNITNSIKIEVYSGTKLVPEAIVVPFSILNIACCSKSWTLVDACSGSLCNNVHGNPKVVIVHARK